ncbi:RNA polymerase sigma factor FliA [Congregibacter brevis]|uniref:RNA polymerase sigma factor FliA n=1 Tax=Congregibacter brevis TaxID=3081201 RepID=A0ABZ0IBX9_9GAMM|nr:RNA polymerase sigma factor FliA [Congregibacter sp. IMCC45268]
MSRASAYAESEAPSADAMVREFLPLVKKIGLRLAAKLPAEIELDDLMQVGLIGLLRARDSYDASQGASFATYAGIRVKGAMLDEIRTHDWLPRSVQSQLRQVSEAIDRADMRLGRPSQDADIAAELEMPLEEYQQLSGQLACARMTHIEDSVEAETALLNTENPFEEVRSEGFREALAESVTQLPEKERLMMSLYYAENLNLKEIGAVLGVSESRVSQLHGQALARLRVTLSHWRE